MITHHTFLLFLILFSCLIRLEAQKPGFLSLDCGGGDNFTDELGLVWTPDYDVLNGETSKISVANEIRKQYTTLRYFPADSRKYCYTLKVIVRSRYLIRATFLYGNFDNNNVYPKFDIFFGATQWSTIVISDADTIEVKELIFLATSSTISVCLSNATTGQPFISTLELRQFNGSVYYTDYEDWFYLSTSARVNFGADSEAPVRFPDDPFDRIWVSDSVKKANFLVDVASGTTKVSTSMPIVVNSNGMPPVKVMQTAVVGTFGSLTYRLDLDGFPGPGWAVAYLAEIGNLEPDESRKFRLVLPGALEYSTLIANIQENALGKYRLYEPALTNLSLPHVMSFRLEKTSDSIGGPLLNAMEINKYIQKNQGSVDAGIIGSFSGRYISANWTKEGGDPCLPVPWSWVQCNSDPQPRIISIVLSKQSLTGNIPLEITKLSGLVELWLDGNSLTGTIPDFTGCTDLKIIHLENNHLTGELPSSLKNLPNLRELYVQNNMISGKVPSGLLNKHLILMYSGNINLHKGSGKGSYAGIKIGASVGGAGLLIAIVVALYIFLHSRNGVYHKKNQHKHSLPLKEPPQKLASKTFTDVPTETAHRFTLTELEDYTIKFEKEIGSGGFGVVYYGKFKNGREIAVKVLTNSSDQADREFSNEVTLLSRIHHRNLVQFIGYCQEGRGMLVYEFMHNGTLMEHLHDPLKHGGRINWIRRLEIALDAAKGIEYLHTGCAPSIIHRDLKSSNILLDRHMRAKVSDFGLSKIAIDETSYVSSAVRGTFGYLDPEYYISQQFTEKTDVYSFGVILLELISGRQPISNEDFGVNRNITHWAKMHIESGDIQGIIDPSLCNEYDIQSVWKIADKALMCVIPQGQLRPSMSEVLKEIQDAIIIEKEALATREGNLDNLSKNFNESSKRFGSLDLCTHDDYLSLDESVNRPAAR